MDSLFKRIDGNIFKLNETVKESPFIIKETVESNDSYLRVSKMDEDFALNYIRRKLLPENVREFNSDVTFLNGRSFTDLRKTTVEEVSRKLVKVFDMRHTGEQTDHIAYKAHIYDSKRAGPIDFKYDIYRDDNDGHLTVKYWYTFARYAFMVNLSKLQKLKENTENESIGQYEINKREEEEAFNFMKRQVIPKLVSDYNYGANQRSKLSKYEIYKQITDKEVIQNLKKMSHKKYNEPGFHSSDYINYRSTLEGGKGPTFNFYIDKGNGDLHVAYDNPFQMNKISYRVGANYK